MAIAKRFALRGDTIMAITKLFELQANANAKKKKNYRHNTYPAKNRTLIYILLAVNTTQPTQFSKYW